MPCTQSRLITFLSWSRGRELRSTSNARSVWKRGYIVESLPSVLGSPTTS